jgi:hypothetical protein
VWYIGAKARAEVAGLEGVKFDAMIIYLKARGADQHSVYLRAFNAMCASHDAHCGTAVALSATGHSEMMTSGLPLPIRVPGFNMNIGPGYGPSETVTMMHTAREDKVGKATADWLQARERLA